MLQALILVPAAAVVFSLQQEKLYEATAQVLIGRQNLGAQFDGISDVPQNAPPDRIIQTEANLARVTHVAEEVVKATGYPGSVEDFLDSSSVSPKQNADLLEFKVRARSPEAAEQLATSYANQYRQYRRELDTSALAKSREGLQRALQDLRAEGQRSSPAYSGLLEKLQELNTREALQQSNAFVIQSATDAVQVVPRPVRNAILGIALGLVLGLGLAFLWEALDTRIRTSDEIEEALGLPLLGRLPAPPRRLRKKNKLITIEQPDRAGAEAFRLLRLNIEFLNYGKKPGAILVTSALAEEGKSTTAANLAVAFARSGTSVALVDLDLRRPYLHRLFDTGGRPGLTQVAMRKTGLDSALSPVVVAPPSSGRFRHAEGNGRHGQSSGASTVVHVLATGPLPPNPGEFVGHSTVASVIEELRQRFDVVIIDTPPLLQVGDAMAIAPQADSLLLVTRLEALRRQHIKELRRALAGAPVAASGFVVTGAEAETGYGYGPYDYEPYERRKKLEGDVIETETRA